MFCGAAPIALKRLIELAREKHGALNSILLIAVPMSDPIVSAGAPILVNARLKALRINAADATEAQRNSARDALTSEAFVALMRSCVEMFRPTVACTRPGATPARVCGRGALAV